MNLDFDTLREANIARLPLFRNKHGVIAHSKPDGSDWSPAQWLQALMGELGEWAAERMAYESGSIDKATFEERSGKELADVQTYLDILARRSLDTLETYSTASLDGVGRIVHQGCPIEDSPAQALMELIRNIGVYANTRKKLDRGDITREEFAPAKKQFLAQLRYAAGAMSIEDLSGLQHPGDIVEIADPMGINLGVETIDKFNEVSKRVHAAVFLHYDQEHARWEVV